ncbi:MAG: hypothetical protein OXC46_07990, partial [Thaumarchaeota archaeon]|nr:hypothetical protein [Nitrososphaerota archaeon]
MSGGYVEKTILEDIMPKFDTEIARKIVINSIFQSDDMKEFAPSQGDKEIQIKSLKDTSCFRIRFRLPVLLHFHNSTRSLHRIYVYFKNESSNSLIGFIPAYNCNLNSLTLLRTYGKTLDWFEQQGANDDEDYFCKLFENDGGKVMEQSSLNFLLQNESSPRTISDVASRLVNECFENHCWSPSPDLRSPTIPDFIFHNSSKIFGMYGVFKTLVKIVDVSRKRYEMQDGQKTVPYVHGSAYIMCQNENDLFFTYSPVKLLILEPTASHLMPDDIANCIISKPVGSRLASQQIMIRGLVKKIDNYDLRQIISSVVWK